MPYMEPGTHDVKVTGHYLGAAKNEKQTKFIAVNFENDLGEHIVWNGWLSEKAMPYTVTKLVDILGWDARGAGGDLAKLDDTHILDGAQATIEVARQESDERYVEVKWLNKLGEGGPRVQKLEDTSWTSGLCEDVLAAAGSTEAPADDIPF